MPQKPVSDSVPEINMLAGTIRGQLNTSGKWQMCCIESIPSHSGFVTYACDIVQLNLVNKGF